MHLTLYLDSYHSKILKLPTSSLHLFQSLFYNLLPKDYAEFLHNKGFVVDGRPFKLFAISWPISKNVPKIKDDIIEFELPVKLTISTPIEKTADALSCGALMVNKEMRVGNNILTCSRIDAAEMVAESDNIMIRTLSPITCYTQMTRQDGRKYTVYFSPYEKDFSDSIYNNLVRKYKALYPSKVIPDGCVTVTPLGNIKERVAKFMASNSFPIKGWEGRFRLNGPKELLQVGLDCGLGAKNSGGWGCVEVL